ncbi:hypothetical protein QZH41_007240 [Actinostola sp. cb2023]|nr:hypothetical protein QZH41_007240 [Actinostola sp. cb2023]
MTELHTVQAIYMTQSKDRGSKSPVNDFIASQPDGKQSATYSDMELALGFVQVANESMCRPIRNLTESQGYDTSKHVLACFGGAGGQHACAMARSLGMSTVFIHRFAGILSAYGIALADIVQEAQEPCTHAYEKVITTITIITIIIVITIITVITITTIIITIITIIIVITIITVITITIIIIPNCNMLLFCFCRDCISTEKSIANLPFATFNAGGRVF